MHACMHAKQTHTYTHIHSHILTHSQLPSSDLGILLPDIMTVGDSIFRLLLHGDLGADWWYITITHVQSLNLRFGIFCASALIHTISKYYRSVIGLFGGIYFVLREPTIPDDPHFSPGDDETRPIRASPDKWLLRLSLALSPTRRDPDTWTRCRGAGVCR